MNFLILLSSHFLADFPLQPKWMLDAKYDVFKTQLGTLSLFAHALIHALVLATIASVLGYDFEFVFFLVGITHFFIDLGKIKGLYGVFVDQILHFLVLGVILI